MRDALSGRVTRQPLGVRMRASSTLRVAVLFLLGCGSADPAPVCDGSSVDCGVAGYFALCAEPEPNQAVEDLDGLYCSWTESGGLDYIGPDLERAPACEGGQLTDCPDGQPPTCYFLPNCLE